MIKESFKRLFFPLLLWKIFLFGVVYLSWKFTPSFFDLGKFSSNLHWPLADTGQSLLSRFCTWDSSHYLAIAEKGYRAHLLSPEFCPLYPALLRGFSFLFGGNLIISGLAVSNVLSLAAAVIFHSEVCRKYGDSIANWALVLWMAYPGSFFLSMIYTEALFSFLVVLFFAAIERKKWRTAALVAFFASLTRHVGIFLVFPFLAALILSKEKKNLWFLVIACLVGYGTNMLVMKLGTGDFFASFKVQKQTVFNQSLARLWDLKGLFNAVISVDKIHGYTQSWLDLLTFTVFFLSLFQILRKNAVQFVYAFIFLVFPGIIGYFSGIIRFIVPLFPVFPAWAADLSKQGRLRNFLLSGLAIAMGAGQIVLLLMHTNWRWVA